MSNTLIGMFLGSAIRVIQIPYEQSLIDRAVSNMSYTSVPLAIFYRYGVTYHPIMIYFHISIYKQQNIAVGSFYSAISP